MTALEALNLLVESLGLVVTWDPYEREASIEADCRSVTIDEEEYERLIKFIPLKVVK